jgi:hypothetical protein
MANLLAAYYRWDHRGYVLATARCDVTAIFESWEKFGRRRESFPHNDAPSIPTRPSEPPRLSITGFRRDND